MEIKLIALALITDDDNLPLCWDTAKVNNMTTTYSLLGHNQSATSQPIPLLEHNQIQHDNNLPPTRTQPKSETSQQHTCSWDTTKGNNMRTTSHLWDTTMVQ